MWMARCLANRMTIAEAEWDIAWRTFNHAVLGGNWNASGMPAPMTFATTSAAADQNQNTMANMFGNTGTGLGQIRQALKAQNLRSEHENSFLRGTLPVRWAGLAGERIVGSKVGDGSPAIVGIYWRNNANNAWVGGHAVVAARISSSNKVVFLDPWQGVLREVVNNGLYPGSGINPGVIGDILYIRPER